MRCSVFQRTGNYHYRNKQLSEDITFTRETEDLYIFGMADGQSGKRFCRLGAKKTLLVAARMLLLQCGLIGELCSAKADAGEVRDGFREELGSELAVQLRKQACRLRGVPYQPDERYDELASTLMMLVVEKKTGHALALNLGDGLICGRRKDGTVEVLLPPERSRLIPHATFLNTSAFLPWHIRLLPVHTEAYSDLLLLSDGVTVCGELRPKAEAAISTQNWDELLPADAADDATVLVGTLK